MTLHPAKNTFLAHSTRIWKDSRAQEDIPHRRRAAEFHEGGPLVAGHGSTAGISPAHAHPHRPALRQEYVRRVFLDDRIGEFTEVMKGEDWFEHKKNYRIPSIVFQVTKFLNLIESGQSLQHAAQTQGLNLQEAKDTSERFNMIGAQFKENWVLQVQ